MSRQASEISKALRLSRQLLAAQRIDFLRQHRGQLGVCYQKRKEKQTHIELNLKATISIKLLFCNNCSHSSNMACVTATGKLFIFNEDFSLEIEVVSFSASNVTVGSLILRSAAIMAITQASATAPSWFKQMMSQQSTHTKCSGEMHRDSRSTHPELTITSATN